MYRTIVNDPETSHIGWGWDRNWGRVCWWHITLIQNTKESKNIFYQNIPKWEIKQAKKINLNVLWWWFIWKIIWITVSLKQIFSSVNSCAYKKILGDISKEKKNCKPIKNGW